MGEQALYAKGKGLNVIPLWELEQRGWPSHLECAQPLPGLAVGERGLGSCPLPETVLAVGLVPAVRAWAWPAVPPGGCLRGPELPQANGGSWLSPVLVPCLQGKEEFEKTQKELLDKGNIMRQGKGQLELQQVRCPGSLALWARATGLPVSPATPPELGLPQPSLLNRRPVSMCFFYFSVSYYQSDHGRHFGEPIEKSVRRQETRPRR